MVRRLLKFAALAFAALITLAVAAAIVGYIVSNRMIAARVTVPVPVEAIRIPEGDPAAIARGEYLVNNVMSCKACHAADFGGRAEIDDPMVGRLWAGNLTTGRGSKVTSYTAVDWVRSIRHGVGPDGHRLILMPSLEFYAIGNEDLGAIVAYIKSRPAVDRDNPGITVGPIGRMLLLTGQVKFAFDAIDHTRPRTAARPSVSKEWGSVIGGACLGCHGPSLSGGPIPGTPPEWPPARNLTRHETGLRGWTLEQFSHALRDGKRPDGTAISTVMPWKTFSGMTDQDVQALWAFLQSVEPRPFGGR